jgi:Glyoxalase-like domain
VELDHVLFAVTDLGAAASHLAKHHGLDSVEGGRHPGWGTANRIVPLGNAYLELIAVVDEREAAESVVGRWVSAGTSGPSRVLGWAVRTPDLDGVAERLDLTPMPGSRATPAGDVMRWRTVGVDQAAACPTLPFFIERSHGVPFPGATAVPSATISRLELSGSPLALSAWLGDHSLPIRIRRGSPGIARVVLAGKSGEILLDS